MAHRKLGRPNQEAARLMENGDGLVRKWGSSVGY